MDNMETSIHGRYSDYYTWMIWRLAYRMIWRLAYMDDTVTIIHGYTWMIWRLAYRMIWRIAYMDETVTIIHG